MNILNYIAGFNVACTNAEEFKKHIAFVMFIAILIAGIFLARLVVQQILKSKLSPTPKRALKATIILAAILIVPICGYIVALGISPWCRS